MGIAREDALGKLAGRALAAAAAAIVVGLFAPAANAAVKCGDVITQDRKLTKDIIDCDVTGLIIGAPDVTLDLNGHRLDGVGDSNGGVLNSAGHDGVTIKGSGGSITAFGRGVEMNGAADATVRGIEFRNTDSQFSSIGVFMNSSSNVLVANNEISDMKAMGAAGIVFQGVTQAEVSANRITKVRGSAGSSAIRLTNGSLGVLVERNRITRIGGHGIDLNDTDSARVLRNRVSGAKLRGILIQGDSDGARIKRNDLIRNEDGILLAAGATSADTRIAANTARLSNEDGIELDEPTASVRRNLVLENGDWGIEAALGTTDLGGNRAKGNAQPGQCLNVACTTP